jgi:hypothetical protein
MNNHECVVVLEVAWILKRFEVGHKTRRDRTRQDQDQRHLVNAKAQVAHSLTLSCRGD